MSKLLHIIVLVFAAMSLCLAAHLPDTDAVLNARSPEQQQAKADLYKSVKPTSAQDAPAESSATAPASSSTPAADEQGGSRYIIGNRDLDGYDGSYTDFSGPHPTKIKTPAPPTEDPAAPTNTKVPVAMVASGGAATSVSDPGFVALAASLTVLTLGMALV